MLEVFGGHSMMIPPPRWSNTSPQTTLCRRSLDGFRTTGGDSGYSGILAMLARRRPTYVSGWPEVKR
jgi:hypothetical protein